MLILNATYEISRFGTSECRIKQLESTATFSNHAPLCRAVCPIANAIMPNNDSNISTAESETRRNQVIIRLFAQAVPPTKIACLLAIARTHVMKVLIAQSNDQRSHAGPLALDCNRDGLPALADATWFGMVVILV